MTFILILLAIYAGIIMSVYFIYVAKILGGKAGLFEANLMEHLVRLIIENGSSGRRKCQIMLLCSFFMEFIYLLMALLLINNSTLMFFTMFLIVFELLHTFNTALAFRSFFNKKRPLKILFNWRMEKITALLFFTHTLLVLCYLIYFQGFS